jgi:segregation and condensation protein A
MTDDPDPDSDSRSADSGGFAGERAPEDALDIVGHDPGGSQSHPGSGGSLVDEASPPAAADAPDEDESEGGGDPESAASEVEPVEILVQLAERGEIEPWDVDIVAVTDAFLAELDERDLRTGGRALFYASVLLRMKSDALLEADEADPEEAEPETPPWDAPFERRSDAPADGAEADWSPDPVAALEAEMDRRLERKAQRGTPETLDELIRDLREAERGSWWKASRTYDTDGASGRPGSGFSRGVQEVDYRPEGEDRSPGEPSRADVTATTHEEDIEATIDSVRAALETQYGGGRREVLFAEVEDAGTTRVQTFLAVLFLAHRGTVTLEQDDLFGDLWVQDARTDAERDGVAAD